MTCRRLEATDARAHRCADADGRIRHRDPSASTCTTAASAPSRTSSLKIRSREDHGLHRAFRLRQEHRAARVQPDERSDAGARTEGEVLFHGQQHLRPARSTRWRCAAASAWCSRSQTRSPRPSTRTSPGGRASTASTGRYGRAGGAKPAAGRPVGRSQGQARSRARWRCPAASSSACASPAPSPSSRRSS